MESSICPCPCLAEWWISVSTTYSSWPHPQGRARVMDLGELYHAWAEIDSWWSSLSHASERLPGLSSQDDHQGRLCPGPLWASIFVNPFKHTDSGRFHQRYGSNPLTPCCPPIRQIFRTEKAFELSFMRNSRAEPIFSFGCLCCDFRCRNKQVLRLDRTLCWLNRWNSGDSTMEPRTRR